MLTAECEAVVEALASSVKREGGELHAQFRNGLSAVIAVRGAKRGLWLDKSDMSGGDMLELVHRVLGKDDHRGAYDWGKRFLGLPDDAGRLADRRQAVLASQARAAEEKQRQSEQARDAISRYVGFSQPFGRAPEIGQYLSGRGIPAEMLPAMPKTLRFGDAEYHVESGRGWPAMLAPIIDPLRPQIIAVHKTFLHCHADAWRKAPVMPAKKVSAPYKGGVIPLLRGASGKPLSLAPEGDVALIAEGIENALAAILLCAIEPTPRTFAAISAPNLPHIRLPPQFAEVILVCDQDGENQSVCHARDTAERNWLAAGMAVSRVLPPGGCKDFADAAAAQRS
jgi:hypothetical protein